MQIWFSCLYDSDLRKIDAQIRCNKSSLGIFSSRRKGGSMEVRKEDQRDQDEKVVEIEIERLRDFKNHPFKVQTDSQMKELQDSISKYGILNPLIVRPRPEGFYKVISGYRRKYSAMELKYTKLSRRLSMQDEAEQKEEVKKATILTYFYPEVTVERMSLYRKK